MHEFYDNLSDNIIVLGERQFEKVYVRGHIYNFSRVAICDYLHILVPDDFHFKMDYALDDVAIELLVYKCIWSKSNVLKVTDVTLKYNELHKISLSN